LSADLDYVVDVVFTQRVAISIDAAIDRSASRGVPVRGSREGGYPGGPERKKVQNAIGGNGAVENKAFAMPAEIFEFVAACVEKVDFVDFSKVAPSQFKMPWTDDGDVDIRVIVEHCEVLRWGEAEPRRGTTNYNDLMWVDFESMG
jgi:hypothetical protein